MSWLVDRVLEGPLEPPDECVPARVCSECDEWRECPCGCGYGWCLFFDRFTGDDVSDECGAFDER